MVAAQLSGDHPAVSSGAPSALPSSVSGAPLVRSGSAALAAYPAGLAAFLAGRPMPGARPLARSDRDSDRDSDNDGESASAGSDKHGSTSSKTASKIAAAGKGPAKRMTVELTGYSWFDNSPAGSSEVSNPVLHKEAGGRGTYADPITVAVADGSFKPGTRFYIPSVRRYVIVEDSGASDGNNHLDMWIGGKGGSKSGAKKCMDRITGSTAAERNPPAGRPVMAGPIYSGTGCHLPKS
jgi:3D (Asp-Asp-Asp) domain-containing protein